MHSNMHFHSASSQSFVHSYMHFFKKNKIKIHIKTKKSKFHAFIYAFFQKEQNQNSY